MKRIFQLTLLSIFSLCTTAMAGTGTSKWQNSPIKIDGNISDWGGLPRFFDSNSEVRFEYRNDANNLYVVLQTTNRVTQMQMMRAGFSVNFRIKTKTLLTPEISFLPHKMGGMHFRGRRRNFGNENGNRESSLQEKGTRRPEKMMNDSAKVTGFQYTKGIIDTKDPDSTGICFAQGRGTREKQQTVYEIQIPLKEIFGDNYSLKDLTRTKIKMQIIINQMSDESMGGMRDRMGRGEDGGMRGGMRGGFGGGGNNMGGMPGGGPGGGMGGGRPEMGGGPGMQGGYGQGNSESSTDRKSFRQAFRLSAEQ